MLRIAIGIAGVLAALCWDMPSSQAMVGDAPWCAVIAIGNGEVEWDCQYQTIEQCQPNVVAGNRGFCNLNPYYAPAAAHAKHAVHRHAHRQPHEN